ncbi:MAG: F0F1 ATP synthase subunit B [Ruminococcus sp.]|nr:F0F1 ATP synthase subunit B [Ruminococcus sp.]
MQTFLELIIVLEFDFWTILFSLINILVLFLFLKKFLFGRVNAMLDERARLVQEEMDKAREEAQQAEKLRLDYENAMSDAKDEARKIIIDAQKNANAQSAAITQQAQEEAGRIVESARQELALERERSVASAQNEIVSLAMEAAEKVLGREIDDDANRAIMDAFLDEEEQA